MLHIRFRHTRRMRFDSLDFALFFPLVFVLYWTVSRRSVHVQNSMLLGASYFFYACWDWRFLFLLAFSTALDFVSGLLIHGSPTKARKRTWLLISVCVNLGFLGLFKYYDFFAASFADLMAVFGLEMDPVLLHLVLPVGISFYTFHGLSYVFDVYSERVTPMRDPVVYALFVSFFPLLVAGPIERATHLLPQLQHRREFKRSQANDGLRQVLWGLFKKMVIADRCAPIVNDIFASADTQPASALVIGAALFAFQIYGDFSGYSDIALGTARLLGIELLQNFSFPYFSRDIAEFWRRWHISLSSWFRDYLYIPLGGSRGGTWMKVRNTFIIFLVSGFWHGAEWTFIAWGGLNALYFLPLLLSNRNRINMGIVAEGRRLPSLPDVLRMGMTFALTCIAWVFFRAENMGAALTYLKGMADPTLLSPPGLHPGHLPYLLLFCLLIEWCGRHGRHALDGLTLRSPRPVRWGMYAFIVSLIGMYMSTDEIPFLYFQF
jgi:alginate O-acetyltransferase complex protein AlgI